MGEQKQSDFSRIGYTYLAPALAVVTGLVGAIVAAQKTVRDRFSKDIRLATSLKHITDPYYKDLDQYATEFFGDKAIDAKTWAQKAGDRKSRYDREITEALEARDFPSPKSGMSGYAKEFEMRYKMMSPNSKTAIVVNSAITAAIGFGGIFTFFNNMQTRHFIQHQMEQTQTPPNER